MAPAPAPATAPTAGPTVGVEGEVAGAQNSMVVAKSEDVYMGAVEDDNGLPIPCSEPPTGPEVASELVAVDKGGDTTESSSSFGDTCSMFDDEADGGEPEVCSQASAPSNGHGSSMLPRRKKVTAEWRNTIRPVMWRCQWLELRMKDISSQISRYDRELAIIEKEKELQQAVSKPNDSVPDAMAIGKDNRNSSMKRRERKRHEDIADTSLYMKKHHILSYYNDKQSKGAETEGHLLDDDSNSIVDGGITGGLDTVALLDSEEYDSIYQQVALKEILLTIDGVQSKVHLLKDRLKKAHRIEDNLAFSEDNTHVRVPRKRQSTQKFCDPTYMKHQNTKAKKCRNARSQKRKNLNILLQDDDGPSLAVKPDRGTDCQIKDTKGISTGNGGEWNHSRDRSIKMDLILGVDNSLPNVHMDDLCKENSDDILIDNQTANEDCPQIEKMEHLPSETSSKGQNTSAPMGVKTSDPMKVDGISSLLKVGSTSATVVNQESLEKPSMLKPVKKREWKPKERNIGWGSASPSMNCSKGSSATSDSEQICKDAPASTKEKTESTPTASMDPEIMTPLAALKKRKAGNQSASAEENKSGNLASKKQNTGTSAGNKSGPAEEHKSGNLSSKNEKAGKSSSGTKKRKTEYSPLPAKKQGTENTSSAAKKQVSSAATKTRETESSNPSKLMVEKAVLVAVNSRRSQRIRKPKVY